MEQVLPARAQVSGCLRNLVGGGIETVNIGVVIIDGTMLGGVLVSGVTGGGIG